MLRGKTIERRGGKGLYPAGGKGTMPYSFEKHMGEKKKKEKINRSPRLRGTKEEDIQLEGGKEPMRKKRRMNTK